MVVFDIILYYGGGTGWRQMDPKNSLASLTLGSLRNPVPKGGAVIQSYRLRKGSLLSTEAAWHPVWFSLVVSICFHKKLLW